MSTTALVGTLERTPAGARVAWDGQAQAIRRECARRTLEAAGITDGVIPRGVHYRDLALDFQRRVFWETGVRPSDWDALAEVDMARREQG